MKNILMNSDFQVWQNGTSYDTPAYTTTADRWVWGGTPADGSQYSVTRSVDVPQENMAYSLTILCSQVSSGSGGAHVRYAVEGYDLKRIWGQECVLSFWAKSNKLGKYDIAASNSEDRTYLAQYEILVADTWEFKEVIIPLDTVPAGGDWNLAEGRGLKLRFSFKESGGFVGELGWSNANLISTDEQVDLFSSVGNYFKMTGVQLHAGNTANEFEPVDYGTDLLRCLRYQVVYDKLNMQRTPPSSAATGSVIRISVPVFVPLAVAETVIDEAPFATLTGTRGTDWRLRNRADNTNTSGTFNGSLETNYGKLMPSIRFENGSFSEGEIYHIQFLTNNGKLRFNAELA